MTMATHPEPGFLAAWVRAELEERGEAREFDALVARGEADGLDRDDAEADAAAELAERRGFLGALETAAEGLGDVEVREARAASEWIERPLRPEGQHDLFGELGPAACTAFLRPAPGAASRLAELARQLADSPDATRAELPLLGGSPGCALR
jgi:hypothetical protein